MAALALSSSGYSSLAVAILTLHALFILWVVFGTFFVWRKPILRWVHIASLVWGIVIELQDWPCPLTLAENWLEQKAGVEPYHGGFLLHYMDKLVYPDISLLALTAAGIIVCFVNLVFYIWVLWPRGERHSGIPSEL